MAEWGHVITAMVTPFCSDGSLDEPGVARMVDYLFEHGSDALVVSGTTGESPTLSNPEKVHLFELAKAAAKGRGAIIAGTGTNDTADVIALSKEAVDVGVDALLLVTPYYNKPNQQGLYSHFKAIADSVDIPIMLYNVPPRTNVNLTAETCLRLAHDCKNIVAVKEASSNLVQVSEIHAGAPEGFDIYSGEDGLVLPTLVVGGTGVVSVTSHLVGKDLQAMCQAYFSGDMETALRLHEKMLPIVRACFQSTTPSPAPVKAALNMLGVSVGPLRLPLAECTERETAIIQGALMNYGLI
jgi:4-hydroxy-tetrahydrodipicolinate synthase